MKVERTNSGKYRVRVYLGKDNEGKRVYKSITEPTSRLCMQKALELIAEEKTFSNNSFNSHAKQLINNNTTLYSPSTIRKYNSMWNTLQKDFPMFCAKPVYKITSDDTNEIIQKYSKTKSAKTVKNYYGFITTVVGDFCHLKATLPKIVEKDITIPIKSEIEAILDASRGDKLELFIMLGSYCMMREAEISALDDKDYNRITKKLYIHKTMVYTKDNKWESKQSTKNYKERRITVPDRVHELILKYGLKFDNPHATYQKYSRLLRRNKFPSYRFHDLRHFGASYLLGTLGCSIAFVKEYGGWKDTSTLMNIYNHSLKDQEETFINAINSNI